MHLCSRICWFENNWIESINQGNMRWCHAVGNPRTLSIYSSSFCTYRLPRHPQDGGYKRSTPWSPTSGDNSKVRIRRPRNVADALCAAGSRCQCCWWLLNKCVLLLLWMCCFQIQELPQGAGGPAVCRPAGRAQAGKCSCTSYVLRRSKTIMM